MSLSFEHTPTIYNKPAEVEVPLMPSRVIYRHQLGELALHPDIPREMPRRTPKTELEIEDPDRFTRPETD